MGCFWKFNIFLSSDPLACDILYRVMSGNLLLAFRSSLNSKLFNA